MYEYRAKGIIARIYTMVIQIPLELDLGFKIKKEEKTSWVNTPEVKVRKRIRFNLKR
jgi:hypothetical protein